MRRTIAGPAILALSLGAMAGCEKAKSAPPPPKPPVVEVALPVTDTVSDYEDFTGRTDAIYSIDVRARVTGYLEKVHFKDGEEVNEGDLLFEIDPTMYQAEYDRAVASVQQSEAHLRRLDADLKRVTNLYHKNAATREEYDRYVGDRDEAAAAVGVAKGNRDLARQNLDWTKVHAPITGRLSRRLTDPGNLVQADTTSLTTIVSQDPMYVYFDIDERTLLKLRRLIREGKIKSRQEKEIAVYCGLADEDDYSHKGLINFSDNKVDPNTGTLRVRGILPNPQPRVLSPGLFMRIRLPVGDPHPAILVPEQALARDLGKRIVYVIRDGVDKEKKPIKVAVAQPVSVGPPRGTMRVITDGLTADQTVVVNGLQRIKVGQAVEPLAVDKKAPAATAGAPAKDGGKGEAKDQEKGSLAKAAGI